MPALAGGKLSKVGFLVIYSFILPAFALCQKHCYRANPIAPPQEGVRNVMVDVGSPHLITNLTSMV